MVFKNDEIIKLALNQEELLNKTICNLGLQGWEIVLASEIGTSQSYLDLMSAIGKDNDYVRRELADMAWFGKEREVGLKIGWALQGSRNSDETSFDSRFREIFGMTMSFIYTVPAKSCDPGKPRAPPYFCDCAEARILLRQGEDAEAKLALAAEKFGQQGVNCYKNFLKQVVRLYSKVIEPIERGPVENRVQCIIDRCVK